MLLFDIWKSGQGRNRHETAMAERHEQEEQAGAGMKNSSGHLVSAENSKKEVR